jgi:hypothetical protein
MSESHKQRRPWRYRGINIRPEKERPRLRLIGAMLFTALCAYTTFAIVRVLVRTAEGASQNWRVWPALVLLGLFAFWAGRRAIHLWRQIAASRRKARPISN